MNKLKKDPVYRTGVVFPNEEINFSKSGTLYMANVLTGDVERVNYDSVNDFDNPHFSLDFNEVKKRGWLFYDGSSARKHLIETITRNQSLLFKEWLFPLSRIEEIEGESVWAVASQEEKRVESIQAWLIKRKPSLLDEFPCFNTKEEAEAFIEQENKES